MAERDNELAIAEGAEPRFPVTTWTGPVESINLEAIFRAFNRVEMEDGARLEEIGYRLPSLSVDDEVTLPDGTVYRVASFGFEEVTR